MQLSIIKRQKLAWDRLCAAITYTQLMQQFLADAADIGCMCTLVEEEFAMLFCPGSSAELRCFLKKGHCMTSSCQYRGCTQARQATTDYDYRKSIFRRHSYISFIKTDCIGDESSGRMHDL